VFAIELARAFIADLESGTRRIQSIHEHPFVARREGEAASGIEEDSSQ
jgi:hypothetical protein